MERDGKGREGKGSERKKEGKPYNSQMLQMMPALKERRDQPCENRFGP